MDDFGAVMEAFGDSAKALVGDKKEAPKEEVKAEENFDIDDDDPMDLPKFKKTFTVGPE